MLNKIFSYYRKNNLFIDATINSAGRDLFEEFIYNNCYQSFMRIVNAISESKKLTPNEKKAVVRFYTAGYSSAIVFYLTNSKNKSIEGLSLALAFLGEDFLKNAVVSLANSKTKA